MCPPGGRRRRSDLVGLGRTRRRRRWDNRRR